MSQKVRKFFPNYRLGRGDGLVTGKEVIFKHNGVYFTSRMPFFGATETQRAALEWASTNTPPVISVCHESPTAPDRGSFHPDPHWLHRSYHPYAMATATLDCFGEDTPRKVKVYFCDVESWNPDDKTMWHSKTAHVVPIT